MTCSCSCATTDRAGFPTQESFGTGGGAFTLSVADFDRNGLPDVAVGQLGILTSEAVVFLNQGAAVFTESAYPFELSAFTYIFDMAVGDVNRDGFPDLVGANLLTGGVHVLANDGDGTFAASVAVAHTISSPIGIAVGDLDCDGNDDLVVVDAVPIGPEELVTLMGDGTGSFGSEAKYPIGTIETSVTTPTALAIADLDGVDGPEIVVSRRIYPNQGDGTFGSQVFVETQGSAMATIAADLDADGDDEVLQASYEEIFESYVAVLANETVRAVDSYCTAGTSASGCRATLTTIGTPSANATSGFSLCATGVEGGKDGLFFFGSSGRQANSWGSGSSFQCVTPPVRRTGLLAGNGTPGACNGVFTRDLAEFWTQIKPAAHPGYGATVQSQLWYRDPQSTSNQTTSLSDALEFVLTF